MATSIQGELERIVYTSEEDSYTVARIKTKDRRGANLTLSHLLGTTQLNKF